jgi:FkbM family methyltransferase
MPSLAKSPIAPILGQRVPLRGPARLLFRSYARTRYQPGKSVTQLTTRTGDHFNADLSSCQEWQLWAFGGFEEHFAELFRSLAGPGDRCIDAGANIGVHTVRLAKIVGGDGTVIAIEPDPDVAERTRHNIMLNGLTNARVVNAAASDRAGERLLYRPGTADTNRARASLLRHPYLTGAATTVPVVTIDEIAGGPITVIKADVEGHEAAVIRGAAATIAEHAPSIVFEYAPELLSEGAQTPFAWLAERGYELFRVRCARHSVTGRGHLVLDRLPHLPVIGGDLLAVARKSVPRIRDYISS